MHFIDLLSKLKNRFMNFGTSSIILPFVWMLWSLSLLNNVINKLKTLSIKQRTIKSISAINRESSKKDIGSSHGFNSLEVIFIYERNYVEDMEDYDITAMILALPHDAYARGRCLSLGKGEVRQR